LGITQCRLVSSYRRFGVACLPPSSWHHSKSFTSTQTLCYFEIWTGRILELLTVRQACSKMFRCVSALPPFYGRTSGTCPRPLCLYALSLSLLSVCMCVCVCVSLTWHDHAVYTAHGEYRSTTQFRENSAFHVMRDIVAKIDIPSNNISIQTMYNYDQSSRPTFKHESSRQYRNF